MSQFLETIKIEDGKIDLLEFHEKRYSHTYFHFFGKTPEVSLKDYIQDLELPPKGIYKLRIVYNEFHLNSEMSVYALKMHERVKLIEDNEIEYSFKYLDRNILNQFIVPEIDDFIIVKNGLITDSWYANIAFLKDKQWFTPQWPLLKGVKREFLLNKGVLQESQIYVGDLDSFEKIAFINGMRDFELVYSFKLEKEFLDLSPS